MEIQLILEKSACGKSHATHLQEALATLYRWVRVEHMHIKVAMGIKDCVLTLQGLEYLSKSQVANIAQAIANVCQTNVRIPMVFRNGLFMEMQYQAG